jgi:nickel/cobalt transporter (NicO) family protein
VTRRIRLVSVGLLIVTALIGTALLMAMLPAFAQSAQNPFSLGGMEGLGARPTSGFSAFILAKQAEFTRAMTASAKAMGTNPSAFWSLIGLGFAYGVFHAAGPGHGKAIIASYIIANENSLKRGALIAGMAALLQGLVAIALVGVLALLIQGTRQTLTASINRIETASYILIIGFGLWLLWRKGRALLALMRGTDGPACDHVHMPGPAEVSRWSRREAALAVLTAGLRPCTGAVLILIFTLSQSVLHAGIAAVLAMSAGTALTTAGLAALAVYFKSLAMHVASGRGHWGLWIVRGLEVLAALLVTLLGFALLFGHWASVGGS